jgi:hypothetical protein
MVTEKKKINQPSVRQGEQDASIALEIAPSLLIISSRLEGEPTGQSFCRPSSLIVMEGSIYGASRK